MYKGINLHDFFLKQCLYEHCQTHKKDKDLLALLPYWTRKDCMAGKPFSLWHYKDMVSHERLLESEEALIEFVQKHKRGDNE